MAQEYTWSQIEPAMAIICCSASTYKPLWEPLLKFFGEHLTRVSSYLGSSDSQPFNKIKGGAKGDELKAFAKEHPPAGREMRNKGSWGEHAMGDTESGTELVASSSVKVNHF